MKTNNESPNKNKLNVLILEDSPSALLDLKSKLIDFEEIERIQEASNYEKAVNILDNTNIDVAFVDLTIPEKTGMDFIVDHLKKHEKFQNIPIIVTTSSDEDSLLKHSLKGLTYRYLHKPIEEEEIREAIDNLPT